MGIRSLKTASISTGAKRSKFWDQSAVISTTAYESIATVSVGSGGSTSASFTSVPATYSHLQVRVFGRGTGTGNREYIAIRFNNDTASNYWWHGFGGSGSAASAETSGSTSTDLIKAGFSVIPVADSAANIFGSAVIDVLDYASTSKYKTTRAIAGQDQNDTTGRLNIVSGVWRNTAAVNRVDLFLGAVNWNQYSSIALYGIKGA
jgi:hypothetical protein